MPRGVTCKHLRRASVVSISRDQAMLEEPGGRLRGPNDARAVARGSLRDVGSARAVADRVLRSQQVDSVYFHGL